MKNVCFESRMAIIHRAHLTKSRVGCLVSLVQKVTHPVSAKKSQTAGPFDGGVA